MSDIECTSFCAEPPLFPRTVHNRPGLSRIAYRIGAYGDFRDEMLRRINLEPRLTRWTHREADDPGIALLECAAVMGDVLTFYQDLYANEAYLRTARWRESVADLVRLTGYRLAPGLSGRATFAFLAKPGPPIVVPAGFPLKAHLEGNDTPTDFETEAELAAWPALGSFHLYRPRVLDRPILAGATSLEIASVDGGGAATELRKGDRVMLVPDASMWDSRRAYTPQAPAEILIVGSVERVLDRTVIHFDGALRNDRGTRVAAYKLGRTFRHFGADAPPRLTTFDNASQKSTQRDTLFIRDISAEHTPAVAGFYPALLPTEMPLDREVGDLAAGGALVCQARVTFEHRRTPQRLTVVFTIREVSPASLVWGHLSGPCSVVSVDRKMAFKDDVPTDESGLPAIRFFWFYLFPFEVADIRTIRFHETVGPRLTLRAESDGDGGPFVLPRLAFHGTRAEARALANRALALVTADGTALQVRAADPDPALDAGADGGTRLWPVSLSPVPDGLTLDDFAEREPRVTVYGNLAEATQGRTEREATVGNGDARQLFQTFKVPKKPLTWLADAGASPPLNAELEVWVQGRLWRRVDSFFDSGPLDEVYVVREDPGGDSWLQFGDGRTGSRLPSGVRNVVAKYRTGTGAFGVLQPGKAVQPGKLDRLDKVRMPGVASGGAPPEGMEVAREAAPARLQTLDRIVSLADVEAEALSIPGVTRARAAWELVNAVPTVVVMVLMEGGREAELDAARTTLLEYDRCRGPRRHPLLVMGGAYRYVAVGASVGLDPARRREDVEREIRAALGVAEGPEGVLSDGLFSTPRRAFAEREWANRVTGVVQNVPGVRWVGLTALDDLGESDDPATLDGTGAALEPIVPCGPRQVLRLHAAHLRLTSVGAPPQEC